MGERPRYIALPNMLWLFERQPEEDESPLIAPIFGENTERGCLCPKRKRIVCGVYRVAAFAAMLFRSMTAYVQRAGK